MIERGARAGLWLGAVLLVAAIIAFLSGGVVLNRLLKGKVERAFAGAHPGMALRLGHLKYSLWANRLEARSVSLSATNWMLRTGTVWLDGVRWGELLLSKAALVEALGHSSIEATNLDLVFPRSHYAGRCSHLLASMPKSELIAEGAELGPMGGDAEFFAVHKFRTTRLHWIVPECRVQGVAFGDLLQKKALRVKAIRFVGPSLDVLVDREKPTEPFVQSSPMVQEALAAIPLPVRVDSLSLTNGRLQYGERVVAGASPGVLSFGAVSIFAENIANRPEISPGISLLAQGDFMNAATLKVDMTIPLASTNFSLHYSGSLGAMDLTQLNPFVEQVEHIRIKSGIAQEALFQIDVDSGRARGRVRALYRNLEIAVLDKQSGSEGGLDSRVASFYVNVMKIRNTNLPGTAGSIREGVVDYMRQPQDRFFSYLWFALRSGVRDIISH